MARSPFAGSKTPGAGYKDPKYRSHLGLDIRPVKSGTWYNNVAAMFSGTVVAIRTDAKRGGKTSTAAAPGRTGDYVLIRNIGRGSSGDGEYQLYNHVWPLVKVGQVVTEGDIIGQNNNTGNLDGAHLHLELWDNNKKTYDPEKAFRAHNIKVGAPLESKFYHTVKSGEVLSLIAKRYNTTVSNIDKLNASIKNVNAISIGQRIRVK